MYEKLFSAGVTHLGTHVWYFASQTHACNTHVECMIYNYIIMGLSHGIIYYYRHFFKINLSSCREGFSPWDDIGRGMIPGLILKGTCHDLFITYFVHNLFLSNASFYFNLKQNNSYMSTFKKLIHISSGNSRISDTLAVQLKTAISVTS